MGFKEKLKKFMEEGNLTQTYISCMTGKSKATVSQWLSGKQIPSESVREDVAEALGLPRTHFYDDEQTQFRRITVEQTARILGCSKDTVRLGLQQGVFPWGYAVQTESGWAYIINGWKLEQVEGVTI